MYALILGNQYSVFLQLTSMIEGQGMQSKTRRKLVVNEGKEAYARCE